MVLEDRPDNLIYWLDDKPPFIVWLLLGVQHIFTMSSMLVLPIVIFQEIGATFIETHTAVSMSMIAAGIGTIIQSWRFSKIGSGYLCPNLCGPSYLSVSLSAAWIGGIPLMRGMTIFSGIFVVILSRFIHKIKFLFPTEVSGLVVLMVGVSLIPLGATKFLGVNYPSDPINLLNFIIALVTLLIMVGINIWVKSNLKLYSVLIGFIVGYILCFVFGVLNFNEFEKVMHQPFFSIPGVNSNFFDIKFDLSLIPPFIIVGLVGSLKTFGNLTTCQKINNKNWKEPDVDNIGNGLTADGISISLSGILGGVATDTSASNVGLSLATMSTSRYIAYSAGGLFIAFGFFPQIAALFSIMPNPVMGAIVVFVTSFMILSGIQILTTEKMTTKKIFIIGLSFIFGISVDIIPNIYASVPLYIAPFFSSSLTLSTILAIILNQLFGEKLKK